MKKILIIIGIILSLAGIIQARIKTLYLLNGYSFEDNFALATVYDWSGNNNSGTIAGAVSIDGKIGVGKYFDGIDDYIGLGRITQLEGSGAEYTIVGYWKLEGTGASRLLFVYDGNSIVNGLDLYMYWDGISNVKVDTGVSNEINANITDLEDGKWHHIALVKTPTNCLIYEDGILKLNVVRSNGVYGDTYTLSFGWGTTAGWKGSQDELLIYNKSLTASEIHQNQSGFSPQE